MPPGAGWRQATRDGAVSRVRRGVGELQLPPEDESPPEGEKEEGGPPGSRVEEGVEPEEKDPEQRQRWCSGRRRSPRGFRRAFMDKRIKTNSYQTCSKP